MMKLNKSIKLLLLILISEYIVKTNNITPKIVLKSRIKNASFNNVNKPAIKYNIAITKDSE